MDKLTNRKLYDLHTQLSEFLSWKQYQEWTNVAKWPCTYERRFQMVGAVTDNWKALAIAGEALILIYADKEQV